MLKIESGATFIDVNSLMNKLDSLINMLFDFGSRQIGQANAHEFHADLVVELLIRVDLRVAVALCCVQHVCDAHFFEKLLIQCC